jgi:hypothetical protein
LTSEKVFLGLDISTSSTGWALVAADGTPIDIGWWDIAGIDGMHLKAEAVERGLRALPQPDGVFVEENVLGFSSGGSTAHVIVTLAKFNAVVSHTCWRIWGIPPISIPAIRARSLVGLKVPRGENVKEHVLRWARARSDDRFWPTRLIKTGKRKGLEVPVQGCFDAADAFLLVNAGMKINQ